MREGVRKIHTIKIPIAVTAADIEEGECGIATKCMIRVAVERVLRKLDPSMPNHHTRVDAGHIWFNYKGHRYKGDQHRLGKANLIKFDGELTAKRKAKRTGKEFKTKVEPFHFVLVAERGARLKKNSDERREQINVARRKRKEAGQKPKKYTLHQRVAGFA